MQKHHLCALTILAGCTLLTSPARSDEGGDKSICNGAGSRLEQKYQIFEIIGVEKGDGIAAICSASRIWTAADAISAIGSGTQFYVCDPRIGVDARVIVVSGSLRTEKDGTTWNNLGVLSDCSHIKKQER